MEIYEPIYIYIYFYFYIYIYYLSEYKISSSKSLHSDGIEIYKQKYIDKYHLVVKNVTSAARDQTRLALLEERAPSLCLSFSNLSHLHFQRGRDVPVLVLLLRLLLLLPFFGLVRLLVIGGLLCLHYFSCGVRRKSLPTPSPLKGGPGRSKQTSPVVTVNKQQRTRLVHSWCRSKALSPQYK